MIDHHNLPCTDPPDLVQRRGAGLSQSQWDVIFWAAVLVLTAVSLYSVIVRNFRPDQFIYLAENLTKGKLSVDDMPLIYPDYAIFKGHVYLPPGPLPAIILIPFLNALGKGFRPGWISLLITLANIFLLFHLLNLFLKERDTLKWLLLLFFGGCVYFGVSVTMVSWYFAHIVATTCTLLSLLTILKNRNPFLGGLFLGLAAACRLSILFAFPALIFIIWNNFLLQKVEEATIRTKARNTFIFIIGLCLPLLLLLWYNYARFGTFFETGYGIDVVGSSALEEARSYGLFSIVHIPRNLYVLLLEGPLPFPNLQNPIFTFPFLQPSPLGMGIFFTSPALLFALKAHIKEPIVKACWLGIILILVPLLSHYATGWIQFGFRYSIDFMPFLIVLTGLGIGPKLDDKARWIILVSVLINLWGTAWLQTWLS